MARKFKYHFFRFSAKSKQLNFAGNSKYLALAVTLGTVGIAGLIYQFTKTYRDEQNRTIENLTRRIQSLENRKFYGYNYDYGTYYDSTFSLSLRNAITANCNKLAEITNLAYNAVSTTTNNNFNFIQRLIAINTNACPAL